MTRPLGHNGPWPVGHGPAFSKTPVWGTCVVTLRDKLQKLQSRAARVLTFSNYDVNAGQLLEILGWKNLDRQ